MKEKMKKYKNYPAPKGYVCVGYGNSSKNLCEVLNIYANDLYSYQNPECFNGGWNGSSANDLYYVTHEVWDKLFNEVIIFNGTLSIQTLPFKVGDKVLLKRNESLHYHEMVITKIADGGKAIKSEYSWYNIDKGGEMTFIQVL